MKVAKALSGILMLFMVLGTFDIQAQDDHSGHSHEESHQDNPGHSEEESDFNAGEMIMSHIQDAHEIHLGGHLAIYLPVILQTDDGFDIFSSSHLYHNEHSITRITQDGDTLEQPYYTYGDYVMYKSEQGNETIVYNNGSEPPISFNEEGELTNAKPFDLSITKSVVGFLLTGILMIWLFGAAARGYKKRKNRAPKGVQSFLEPLILFVRDEIAVPSIGNEQKARTYLPFLLTIFFFIWIANMLGLLPFLGFNVTGTIGVTLTLAAIVFIITTFSGNKHYWGHIFWPPGVPLPIKVILVPIEIAGIFIRPTVLMIRLTANITAGHIIILAFVSLILIFGQQSDIAGGGVGIGSTLFMVFMFFIELLVAFLQAYVFTLLAALYFGDAKQEAHH